jgi:hypothetical protein
MSMKPVVNPNRGTAEAAASDRLHPFVYLALIGAAALFGVAVWGFAGGGYVDYLLVIVSGFAVIAVAIPVIMSRVGGARPFSSMRQPPFREWSRGDFSIWQDRVRGSNAAIEILLPLCTAAIGMVAFGIVLHLTEHGV